MEVHHAATNTTATAATGGGSDSSGGPLIRLDNTKAGMSKVDKAHVEAVINEMSKGSPFYANEQRKAAARQKRINSMKAKAAAFDQNVSPVFHSKIQTVVDAMARRFQRRHLLMDVTDSGATQGGPTSSSSSPEMLGVFVHLDMDMFFAAVEEKRNPALKNVPFGVGGMGMLSTTNYLAREYGVRAGMPGYIGRRLCPELVFAHSSFDVYREESAHVRSIVAEYDPHFVSGGLDELTMNLTPFLETHMVDDDDVDDQPNSRSDDASFGDVVPATTIDVGGTSEGRGGHVRVKQEKGVEQQDDRTSYAARHLCDLLHRASKVAEEIRARVLERTQLTASCGIAPTPCLAKIVANYQKPNGQFLLDASTRGEVMKFVHALSIRTIPGIGKVSEEMLTEAFGVHTCGDLYEQRYRLYHCVTPKLFEFLLQIGLGVMGSFGGFGETGTSTSTADARAAEENDEEDNYDGDDAERGVNAPHRNADNEDEDVPTLDRKSISHERTFRSKLFPGELVAVAEKTLRLSHELLVEEHLLAKQVGIKLKYTSFEVRQVTVPLSLPTQDADVLHEAVMQLLSPFLHEFFKFRLLGVRLAGLSVAPKGFDQAAAPRASVLATASASMPASPPSKKPHVPTNTLDKLFAAATSRKRARSPAEWKVDDIERDDDGDVTLVAPPMRSSVRAKPAAQPFHHEVAVYSISSDDDDDHLAEDAFDVHGRSNDGESDGEQDVCQPAHQRSPLPVLNTQRTITEYLVARGHRAQASPTKGTAATHASAPTPSTSSTATSSVCILSTPPPLPKPSRPTSGTATVINVDDL